MAITDTTKITGTIKQMHNSTDPGCGCGGAYIDDAESLPSGDYVAMQGFNSSAGIELENIVWKGEPWLDKSGAILTALTIDMHRISGIWYANIESCDVTTGPVLFYNRCK